MDNIAPLIRWLQSHRATMLLILTILLLLALSITERYRYGIIALAPLILLVIVAAARVASPYRRIFRAIIIPLAIAFLVARVSAAVGAPSGEPQGAWVPGLALALTVGLIAVLLRGLAEARNVTTETISQAFSGYLLIAIAFAQFYVILNNFIPGAFNPPAPTGGISLFIYFSFSTLTSVGFGDVTPLDPFVRIVAALEATTGIFYQTVVIARLVSLYIPRHAPPPPDPARRPEGKPLPS
jgi:ion channel